MSTRSRRVAAALMTLGIIAGLWRPCAGWEGTAEARMSCCVRKAMCAMHKPGHGSPETVNQAEADMCCAASDRPETAPASVTVLVAPPLVPVLALFAEPPAVVPLTAADWHGPPPFLGRQLPRHLLLSVFLI